MTTNNTKRVIVYGESLIDLVDDGYGSFTGLPGGSPYNVARALGLQNIAVNYICPLSADAMGTRLRDELEKAGVRAVAPVSPCPTSLALISLDADRQPQYSLYRTGVADRDIDLDTLKSLVSGNMPIFFCGSLVFIPDEINKTMALVEYACNISPRPLICVDLNMRPQVVNDQAAYSRAVERVILHADLIKLSDEDLRALPFGTDAKVAAAAIAKRMYGGAVIITLGEKGCLVHTQGHSHFLKPPITVNTVDTIGAGDCFQAGLITWLHDNGIENTHALEHLNEHRWKDCLDYAGLCAAINVSRQGCQPPTRQEIQAKYSKLA